MTIALWALIAVPAVAGLALAAAGRRAGGPAPTVGVGIGVVVLGLAAVVAWQRPAVTVEFVAGAPFGLAVDGLAAVVVPAVAAVAVLVLLFAVGDITGGRARFFGLMLLFVAAVLLTATAATLPALLMGWEVMGATSYALIAFQWRDRDRLAAGATAFLTTRLGDLGLYLAGGAAVAAGAGLHLDEFAGLPGPWRHIVAGGVLAAAFGKAAQLPFSFWLSKAMLGPSPVSALLHSAAMVAMGGYLLLRLQPLLTATGWASSTAASVGAISAVVLGVVAVGQSDLKQLLAASTVAQLGFVVLAAGAGGVAGGAAHLIGHAATKALLFLAAGAWLSMLGTRQLAALQGAGRRDRLVGVTFTIGAVSLAGVPPLALWATKDDVLAAAKAYSTPVYVVAFAGALLSAAYAGKAVGMVLRPLPPDPAGGYDTEQPGIRRVTGWQKAPLVVLAAGAAVLGMLSLPPVAAVFAGLVGAGGGASADAGDLALSGGLAVLVLATAAWLAPRIPAPGWARGWLGLAVAADRGVVRPVLALARLLARFDDRVLDRAVLAVVPAGQGAARLLARADRAGVDALVMRTAAGARRLGQWARRPQTGQSHQYYAQAVVVLTVAALLLLLVR